MTSDQIQISLRRASWCLKRPWLPRRCLLSNEWVWFGLHYRLSWTYMGYTDHFEESSGWVSLEVGTRYILMKQ